MIKKRTKWCHPLSGRSIIEAISDVFEVPIRDVWQNRGFYSCGGASWGVYNSPKSKELIMGRRGDLHCFDSMRDCLRLGYTIIGNGEIVVNDPPFICDVCGKDKTVLEMSDVSKCKDCLT